MFLSNLFSKKIHIGSQNINNNLLLLNAKNSISLGNFNFASDIYFLENNFWKEVSLGSDFALAIDNDNKIYSWGSNRSGQLGLGTIDSSDFYIESNIFYDEQSNNSKGIVINEDYDSIDKISFIMSSGYAIKNDGTLWAWGSGNYQDNFSLVGQTKRISFNSPVQIGSDSDWKSITNPDETYKFISALKNDGSLWTWGTNYYGNLGLGEWNHYHAYTDNNLILYFVEIDNANNQKNNRSWVSVSGSYGHSSGIKSDGSLWTWGAGGYGNLGIGEAPYQYDNPGSRSLPVQVGKDSWIMCSSGGQLYYDMFNVAIKSDGTLWTWGANTNQTLGLNDPLQYGIERSFPVQVKTKIGSNDTWSYCFASCFDVYAINSDGGLWGWGANYSGELGQADSNRGNRPTQITTQHWNAVSAGKEYTLAIKNDGSLWAWGLNYNGELGQDDLIPRSSPVQIGTSSWTAISAGASHSVAIKSDGTLWSWGSNNYGLLGQGDRIHRSSPVQVGTSSWTAISVGDVSSYAIMSDGTLWAWGGNFNGALGQGNLTNYSSPVQIGTSSWSAVSMGVYHVTAIKSDGTLWAWGKNDFGQLGQSDLIHRSSPVQIGTSSWSLVSSGYTFSAGIKLDETLWTWGNNFSGQLGQGDVINRSSPVQVSVDKSLFYETLKWGDVQCARNSVSAVTTGIISFNDTVEIDGLKLWTWGFNGNGELGQGDKNNRSLPVQIGSTYGWFTTSHGWYHTIALYQKDNNDKLIYSWGQNQGGQLGHGNTAEQLYPKFLVDKKWKLVCGSRYRTAGITTDGELWIWGGNYEGELGQGNYTSFSVPIQVGTEKNWKHVSMGYNTVGIKTDGTLWAWGSNYYGENGYLRPALTNILSPIQVGIDTNWSYADVGNYNVIATKTDGTLWAWGSNYFGQFGLGTPPTYLDRIYHNFYSPIQIGVGYTNKSWVFCAGTGKWAFTGENDQFFAIDSGGNLWGAGGNNYGELGQGNKVVLNPRKVDNSSWNIVKSGYFASVGIKSDGTLWTWGSNLYGELGHGDHKIALTPKQVTNYTDWVDAIEYPIGIRSDGSLWAAGKYPLYSQVNSFNQFSKTIDSVLSNPSSWNIVSNESSPNQFAIKADGTLWAWGYNHYGQLGLNDRVHRLSPVQIGTSSWNAISSGYNFAVAIKSDGTLWSWGINDVGQLGQGVDISNESLAWNVTISPVQIGTSSWTAISTGTYHSIAIKSDGTLWSWGYNFNGELGQGDRIYRSSPVQVGTSLWTSVSGGSGGGDHTLAIRSDGTLWAWGRNNNGQLGQSDLIHRSSPVQIGTSSWSIISAGYESSFAINSNGTLWSWGRNFGGELGVGNRETILSPVQIGTYSWNAVSGGTESILAIRSDRTLWNWSLISKRYDPPTQFNSTSQIYRSSPVQVGVVWGQISSVFTHSLGIKNDGSLWAWGYNYAGELGKGDGISTLSPVQIGTSSWSSVSTGYSSSFGIKSDGTLWSWGLNVIGRLGLGDKVHRSSPVQIGTSSWISVSSGKSYVTAIRSDGTLWAWGDNSMGTLGQGDRIHRSSPVQIGTSSWTSVSSGGYHTLAIRSDNTLWSWGRNTDGRLGQGDLIDRSSPVQIGTSSWTSVFAGYFSSFAIKPNGTLWAWGYNHYGELGQGDTIDRSSPVQVGTSSWSSVSYGAYQILAIKSDNTLWAWGGNFSGQLGQGDLIDRSSPVQVGTSSWSSVSAGKRYNSFAIKHDGTLWSWGYNFYGTLGQGDLIHRSSPVQIGTYDNGNWSKVIASRLQDNVYVPVSGQLYKKRYNVDFAIKNNGEMWSRNYSTLRYHDNSSMVKIDHSQSWTAIFSAPYYTNLSTKLFSNGLQYVLKSSDNRLWGGSFLNDKIELLAGGKSYSFVSSAYKNNRIILRAIDYSGNLWEWGEGKSIYDGNIGLVSTNNIGFIGDSVIKTNGKIEHLPWTPNQNSFLTNKSSEYYGRRLNFSQYRINNQSWATVSAGLYVAHAIRSDGTLWAWGNNTYGILSRGDSISRSLPSICGAAQQWKKISSGYQTIALKYDGSLWSWGKNTYGSLGQLDLVHRSSPIQIGTDYWTSISSGFEHITASNFYNEFLWTCGRNNYGQLAMGDTTNRSSLSQISFNDEIFTKLAQGYGVSHTAAISTDSLLYAWGYNGSLRLLGGTDITTNKPNKVQVRSSSNASNSWTTVSTSTSHTWAIAIDGSLYRTSTSGMDKFGESQSWSAVSSSRSHALAIKSDGTLWVWGRNYEGQLGLGTKSGFQVSPILSASGSWVSVQSGSNYTIALKTDGTLWAWGNNINGQLGQGEGASIQSSSPVQIGGSWSSISAGDNHVLAIKPDGSLWSWGSNINGQLGYGYVAPGYSNVFSPKQVGTSSWSAISASRSFSVAIKSDNTLWAWGRNFSGQLGQGDLIDKSSPVQVGTSSWSSVSSKGNHVVAKKPDDTVWAWGNNPDNRLGQSDVINRSSPVQIGTSSWNIISAGRFNTYLIDYNGTLWAVGRNAEGQLGQNNTLIQTSPVQIGGSWTSISSGYHALALRTDNTLWSWGRNYQGQLGLNDTTSRSSPVQVGGSWTSISSITVGFMSLAIRSDSSLWGWGGNDSGQLAGDNILYYNQSSFVQISASSWTAISAGASYSVAIKLDGTLWAWGNNQSGKLGQNDLIHRSSPVQVGGSWTSISATFSHVTAIRSDGTLWAWGRNYNGQLGQGDLIDRSSPVQIGTSSWTSVSSGGVNNLAIKANGTLWAWGRNTNGQLGQGDRINRSSPVQIGTSSWNAISSGYNFSVAIKSDNTIWAWGRNYQGQLGLGDLFSPLSPVQTGLNRVLDCFSSENKTAVITKYFDTSPVSLIKGRLYVCGSNSFGELGFGDRNHRSKMSQVGLSTDLYSQYSSGFKSSYFIRDGGSLWSAGNNTNGQLGQGDRIHRSSPVQIGTSSWSFVSGGYLCAYGIRSDSTLWAWGDNSSGQLGQGDLIHRSSPVQIGTSVIWKNVYSSKKTKRVSAIDLYGTVWSWGDNANGQLGQGDLIHRSSPVQIGISEGYDNIAVGEKNQFLSLVDIFSVGYNSEGQLGLGDTIHRSSLTIIPSSYSSSWTLITAGKYSISGIKTDGSLWTCGFNTTGQLGHGDIISRNILTKVGNSSWSFVSASQNHTLGIRSDGTLWAWGANHNGQLGQGDRIHRSSPVQIGTSSWISVGIALNESSFAVKANGTLWVWGINIADKSYKITDNIRLEAPSSTNPKWDSACVSVFSSFPSILGIRNGSLWAWGSNYWGKLGTGDQTSRLSAVQIGTSTWISVSSSTNHSIAIRSDGSLWAWGRNTYGQLGQSDTISRSSPVQIGTSSWSQVSAGLLHNMAIRSDGTLWGWGDNYAGRLGLGDRINRSSPVQIGGSWNSVSCVYYHTLGIKSDGTLWAWGRNAYGQLGQGDLINRSSPVQIGINSWSYVSAGVKHSAAIRLDGSLWTWGRNVNGQLGLGHYDRASRSYPVKVGTSSWTSVSALNFKTYAIRKDNTLWAWGVIGTSEILQGLERRILNIEIGGYSRYDNATHGSPIYVGSINDNYKWKLISGVEDVNSISVCAVIGLKSDGTISTLVDSYNISSGGFFTTYYPFNIFSQFQSNIYLSPVQVGSDTNWLSVYSQVSVPTTNAQGFVPRDGEFFAKKTNGTIWNFSANYGMIPLKDLVGIDLPYNYITNGFGVLNSTPQIALINKP
jgi:alpha-tubulin suppressor-like RCC1 family protein